MNNNDLDDPVTHDPVLRQLRPTSESIKPSRSWWENTDRVGFTEKAERQRERMKATKEYQQVAGSFGV